MIFVFVSLFIALVILWGLATILLFIFSVSCFMEGEWMFGMVLCIFGVACLIITIIALIMLIFIVLV